MKRPDWQLIAMIAIALGVGAMFAFIAYVFTQVPTP